MKIRVVLRRLLWTLAILACVTALSVGAIWWYLHPRATLEVPVTYGKRHGEDLTVQAIRPDHPNGRGVLVMISGSWKSSRKPFEPWLVAALLRDGYTILAVRHLSQPQATVMEIVDDVARAVRFVRLHATDFQIDPGHLGVTGASSGGHLSLMLATLGDSGNPASPDPVLRESSAVQAAAVFCPVTDLLNLGDSTENAGDGGPPKSFVRAFGPDAINRDAWRRIGRSVSPIYHVRASMPPVLILHGDADTLVPLDQSLRFQARAREVGARVEVVVRPWQGHVWLTMPWDMRRFCEWFDSNLAAAE